MTNKIFAFYIVVYTVPLLIGLCSKPCSAKNRIDMTIDIAVDIQNQSITGQATTSLSILQNQGMLIGKTKVLKVETIDGAPLDFSIKKGKLSCKIDKGHSNQKILIHFKVPSGSDDPIQGNRLVSKDFILLTGAWCPLLKAPSIYRLNVRINRDFGAISEADKIMLRQAQGERNYSFVFDHPRQSVTLAAARFFNYDSSCQEVNLSVHLLKKDPELAKKIIDALKTNLKRYRQLISPYPFKRFQVVEVPRPIGITVPTLTLVGSQIIDKPFLINTSLIHEFVHSWFGNSVFVDERGGNWSEGLTTYLADYLIAEKQGKGPLYRHDLLSDYKAYVHSDNSFALSAFRYRHDRVSKAIGYGKGAMIFHMLRRRMGDEKFFQAISYFARAYQFRTASWHDIEKIFSRSLHLQMKPFFKQWLERKDVPQLKISYCAYQKASDENYETKCSVKQLNTQPYTLKLPLQILTEKNACTFDVDVKKEETSAAFTTHEQPKLAIIDPNYEIMRDLAPEEFPPSLSRLFGAEKRFVLLPDEKELSIYSPIVSFLEKMDFKTVERKKIKHSMLKNGAFLVLGSTKGRLESFTGKIKSPDEGVIVNVRENPLNPTHVVVAIKASSKHQLKKMMRKLPYYGRYSFLEFKDGILLQKKRAPFDQGISKQINPSLSGIFSDQIRLSDQIIKGLESYQVVYLGEKHDQQGIHQAQLEIIQKLSKLGPMAVGMEMFQRPFQKVIDKYLAGKIDERQFLKESEYFKRWAFNYHFYRPIIEFCKENHIPIVALNLPTGISKKIARTGLGSLAEQELKQLPEHLDLTNELYKRYLKQVYSAHKGGELQDFQHFFEAQIAWDETMAHSIATYIKKHPHQRMVIIVGGGHVEFGYGIPSRVKRRIPGISQAITLFNESSISDPSKADLFLYVPPMEEPFAPKLGVILDGKNKLTVERVIPGSPASKAGFKKGDEIVKIDGTSVKDIYDLKSELFFKKRGERITIRVKRKDADGKTEYVDLVTGKLEPFNWEQTRMKFHFRK